MFVESGRGHGKNTLKLLDIVVYVVRAFVDKISKMTGLESSFFAEIRNGSELTTFVSSEVQLPKETQKKYNAAVEEIVSFLAKPADYGSGQPRDFPWKFKRVFKSGSLTKGTAVRRHADVDLVCFIEKSKELREPVEFLRLRETIIEDIANKFGAYYKWTKEGSHWKGEIKNLSVQDQRSFIPLYNFHNGYLLNVKLMEASGGESYSLPKISEQVECDVQMDDTIIDVDIIPGFDLYDHLRQKPGERKGSAIFNFIREQEHPMRFADQFSASLAEMQWDFIQANLNKQNRNNLKKLILLTKFWFKTEVKSRYNRVRFPSYLIELLCLHVFQKYCLEDTRYDILTWFYKVLEVIEIKEELKCIWTDQYQEGFIPWEVKDQRPLIVDPANPFNNVAGGIAQWPEIYACARWFKRMLEAKYGGTDMA